MFVAAFLLGGLAYKLAVQNDGIFIKGEQRATFNGIYCCTNTWRHCGTADEGANVVKVVKDGVDYELFFTYTFHRNATNELPISDLTLVYLDGSHSPTYPFNYEKSAR